MPAGHEAAATAEPDLDSASAAAFWRSEKSRAEGQFLAALRHLQFNRTMLADAFTRSVGSAVAEGSQSGRVHFVDPQSASGSADRGEGSSRGAAPSCADATVASGSRDKGKGRAESPAEEESRGKGKGCADPMDVDKPPASSSDEGKGWGGF